MDDVLRFLVNSDVSIRKASKILSENKLGFCVIVNRNNKVIGVFSDGDYRRAILNGLELSSSVFEISNMNFLKVEYGYKNNDIKDIFKNSVVTCIPVIKDGELVDIIVKDKFIDKNTLFKKQKLENSVVIMAGGKGTRLEPFTKVLPKPLIPIGDTPIIELIINEFINYSTGDIYITINDKARMIRAYFSDHHLDGKLNFIEEDCPLGTAGSLKYLEGMFSKPFFLSNCDVIVKFDYSEVVDFHNDRDNSITIIGSMQHHKVPYGICEINNGGGLIKMKEKPEYSFLTNTGVYLINPKVIECIPKGVFYDMNSLIDKVQEMGLNVGVFPISDTSWHDVGEWGEYAKTRRLLLDNA